MSTLTLICALAPAVAAFNVLAAAPTHRGACAAPAIRSTDVQMINLFGNNDESKARRDALSRRDAQAGDRVVQFRKPNSATAGLELGLVFRESFGKAVYIDKIIPNSEAARLERQGKLSVGDQVTMVSATFGDELWSARGIGKYRLEKSIAVRQGMTISFVLEGSSADEKKRMKKLSEAQKKENAKMSRLQAQLAAEVDAEKEKSKGGGFFGLF